MKILTPDELPEVARGPLVVEDNPLQRPGKDERIQHVEIAGPKARQDTRMYFSQSELEGLLEIAKASPVRRVELPMVGLVVDTWRKRKRNGETHEYQTWQLTSGTPRPERPAVLDPFVSAGKIK